MMQFQFLTSFVEFDDKVTREERWKFDTQSIETNNEASKLYVSGNDEYTKYLGGSQHKSLDGCNISMDQYFTSVTIVRWA